MIVGGVGGVSVRHNEMELRYGFSTFERDRCPRGTTTSTYGDYYCGKIHHGFDKFDLTSNWMRFPPYYAPAILPYGTQETFGNIAWAPRSWFNQYYQFVDNSVIGSNRQGWRASTNSWSRG